MCPSGSRAGTAQLTKGGRLHFCSRPLSIPCGERWSAGHAVQTQPARCAKSPFWSAGCLAEAGIGISSPGIVNSIRLPDERPQESVCKDDLMSRSRMQHSLNLLYIPIRLLCALFGLFFVHFRRHVLPPLILQILLLELRQETASSKIIRANHSHYLIKMFGNIDKIAMVFCVWFPAGVSLLRL